MYINCKLNKTEIIFQIDIVTEITVKPKQKENCQEHCQNLLYNKSKLEYLAVYGHASMGS